MDDEFPAARCHQRQRDAHYKEFIPETRARGGQTVLPLAFPDGSTAELVYPSRLRLAELGVQPAVSVGIQTDKAFSHERFLLITKTPLGMLKRNEEPLQTFPGPTGKVTVWRAKEPADLHPVFMHFRVGSWNVIVGDGNAGSFMGRRSRRLWASNLAGRESPNGFPVLVPRPPLAFARGPGEPDIYLSTCFRFLELRLEKCADLAGAKLATNQTAQLVRGVTVQRSKIGREFGANWCTPSRQLSVYVSDRSKTFVDRVAKGLRVTRVERNQAATFSDR